MVKLIYFALISFVLFAQVGFAQEGTSGAKSPEAGNAYNNGLNFAKNVYVSYLNDTSTGDRSCCYMV